MSGLAPHDRRLRLHRFEVTGYRQTHNEHNSLIPTTPTARYATRKDAIACAATMTDEVVLVTHHYPANLRYPEGPWVATRVLRHEPGSVAP